MPSWSVDKNKNVNISPIIIRPAKFEDLRDLTEVLAYSFYHFPKPLGWVYSLLKLGIYEDLRGRLRSHTPLYCCLVALTLDSSVELSIVGTVEIAIRYPSVWSLDSQYPYISNLAVMPNYRRQGIGKKLLAKCEQVALNWGYQETRLHVLKDNDSAKQLYFRQGYHIDLSQPAWNDIFFFPSQRLLLSKNL